MARYKNKWAELPPPSINPRKWGFDPKKGWKHAVSADYEEAYVNSRLEQLEIEEGPLKEDDLAWLNDDQAFIPGELRREALVKAQEAKDVQEMDIEAAFAALTA